MSPSFNGNTLDNPSLADHDSQVRKRIVTHGET